MWRLLRLVLTIVTVAALSVATSGFTSALRCSVDGQRISVAASISHNNHMLEGRCHHHHVDGKCSCPCCCAAGGLALATPMKPPIVETNRFVLCTPAQSAVPAGIAIRPVTGPPKLAV
jgi:hypothetical protein